MSPRHCVIAALCALSLGGASWSRADSIPSYVAKAVADVARPPGQIARDAHRKPAELIAFAGIKPGETVIDLMPGTGYWTRIFSKLVGPKGHVYSFVVQPPSKGPMAAPGPAPDPIGEFAWPAPLVPILSIQHIRGYENVLAILADVAGYGGTVGVPTQVDAVWTADNYHDFHNAMFGPLDMVAINKAIFRDLKPGGIYMVIDHAAKAGDGFNDTENLHRSDKEAVKGEVTAAGFEFVGESNLLANAADDHSQPASTLHDTADQYVLKFRKPASAPGGDKRPGDRGMKNIYGNTFVLGTPDKRFRTIFYHPDGTYQEFGFNDTKPDSNGMQAAYWFWDADGHNCMLHQYPESSEGHDICHPWSDDHTNAKLGVPFKEYGANGQAATVTVVPGYQYPNTTTWPKD